MLIRTIKLRLFKPGNKESATKVVKAGTGRHFTAENIEAILTEFANRVEAAMPDRYRMVQVGRAEFNFVRITPPKPPFLEPFIAPTLESLKQMEAKP